MELNSQVLHQLLEYSFVQVSIKTSPAQPVACLKPQTIKFPQQRKKASMDRIHFFTRFAIQKTKSRYPLLEKQHQQQCSIAWVQNSHALGTAKFPPPHHSCSGQHDLVTQPCHYQGACFPLFLNKYLTGTLQNSLGNGIGIIIDEFLKSLPGEQVQA